MIPVEPGVQLEVLDWGGTGQPMIFLSGLGNTAHIWDDFAPRFAGGHHVYAITRRGFGRSTHAATGYSPERLAEDIVAVMDRLGIDKAVLVGHSIAGEELSAMGTRHPDRIAALIYLSISMPPIPMPFTTRPATTRPDSRISSRRSMRSPPSPKTLRSSTR